MPRLTAEIYCERHLYSSVEEMKKDHVPDAIVKRIIRIRDVHTQWLNTPNKTDKELVLYLKSKYDVSESTSYDDLRIVKLVIGNLTRSSKDFMRWKASNMAEHAYKLAENRKDARGMAAAIAVYVKINQLDRPDDVNINWDEIKVQPFKITENPECIGITRIPHLDERVVAMKKKYWNDDIKDVTYDEVDLNAEI